MRWHVISAVFSRNVKQYFSGVLGYLFLIVFVLCCAVLAFSPQFFSNNLANLDQLSRGFPFLLLFFIPAITMTTWSEEKRRGTDALLFTLPASDLEIMLGKYLAVAAVYTIALLFSMTQLVALSLIGNPDWGVIFSTYLGYWLAGLAMLSIGMFASSLTSSPTVAFVLGAVMCAVPVLLFGPYFRGILSLEQFGFEWNLRDFTLGLIPLSSALYFVSIIILMLYLNYVVISRRHWSRGQQVSKGGHFLVRTISLVVALVCLNYVIGQMSSSLFARIDMTAENIYSLDEVTKQTLKTAKENNRPITVQAFISSEVPRKFVSTRKQFAGLLRQFKLYGGNNLDVRYVDVQPNSPEEQEAQQLGIEPQNDRSEVGGRTVEQQVYMGALISSPQGDVVLPYLDDEAALEYELAHSIATSSDKDRKITLGIVDTDTFFAGPEFDGRRVPWAYESTMSRLRTQYRIRNISQDGLNDYVESDVPPPTEGEEADLEKNLKDPPDVLLVPDPSSLTDTATKALVKYMQAGNPTILLADPLPFYWTSRNPTDIGILNAPRQPRINPRSPYSQVLASAFLPKADEGRLTQISQALGVQWDNGTAAWSLFNPHPNFRGAVFISNTWPEYYGRFEKAFVYARDHSNHQPFNQQDAISSGLREILFFYPGSVSPTSDAKTKFTPLITLAQEESGATPWNQLTFTPTQIVRGYDPNTGRQTTDEQRARSQITSEDLIVLRPSSEASLELDQQEHVLAAHLQGNGDNSLNVVFISDMDFLSDLFFEQQSALGQSLDNVALLENAIDVLAGDEQFVALRNRRPAPRTLTEVETQIEKFRSERVKKQEEIESSIRDQLAEAQAELDKAAEQIGQDQSLSFFEKLQQTSQQASQSQRRFDIKKEKLDKELALAIKQLETDEQQSVNQLETRLGVLSISLAILPALLLGIIVLIVRTINERSLVTPARRAR